MSEDPNWNLLAKYLSGECSEEEEAQVQAWIEEDPTRGLLLEELKLVWGMTEDSSLDESTDVGALWARVEEQTREEDTAESSPKRFGSFFGESGDRPSGQEHARRSPSRSYVGQSSAQQKGLGIAVVLVLIAVATFWVSGPFQEGLPLEGPSPEKKTFTTQEGQRAVVRLADGTRVQLNVDSRLTLPATFGDKHREVRLRGEAFFEVERDSTRPFIIRTAGAVTRVLGTSFDVSAYPEDGETKVVVSQGQVALSDESSAVQRRERKLILTKRQMGRLLQSGEQIVRKDVDVNRHLGWMKGQLTFEEASFKKVTRKLERWYAITVSLEKGAPDPAGHLNAQFAEDQPLDEVLNVVAAAFGLEYERDQKHVTFAPVKESRSP